MQEEELFEDQDGMSGSEVQMQMEQHLETLGPDGGIPSPVYSELPQLRSSGSGKLI